MRPTAMRRTVVAAAALALCGSVATPAAAASVRIGGPCKKVHQVDWIKGVRAQCTWVPAKTKKKGKLIWKALPPAKTTATRAELSPTPAPSPSASPTDTASPTPSPTTGP